jgi:hypothetical protein
VVGTTVTVIGSVFTQPLTSVPVTVYVIEATGVEFTVEPEIALKSVPGDQV